MNATEKIQAAIESLSRLHKGCLPGWEHCYSVSGGDGDSSIRSARGGEVIADLVEPHHADLIAALHRTIDAQLAVLRLALEYGNLPEGSGSRFTHAALTLADALLADLA